MRNPIIEVIEGNMGPARALSFDDFMDFVPKAKFTKVTYLNLDGSRVGNTYCEIDEFKTKADLDFPYAYQYLEQQYQSLSDTCAGIEAENAELRDKCEKLKKKNKKLRKCLGEGNVGEQE